MSEQTDEPGGEPEDGGVAEEELPDSIDVQPEDPSLPGLDSPDPIE